jgi:hypothetical protein
MPGPWRCQGIVNRSPGWRTKAIAHKCYEIRAVSTLGSAPACLRRGATAAAGTAELTFAVAAPIRRFRRRSAAPTASAWPRMRRASSIQRARRVAVPRHVLRRGDVRKFGKKYVRKESQA